MTKDKTNIEEIKEIHKEIIDFMDSIGFGLLTDGDTFYKKGYEIEPREHTTFTMRQAYEIRNRTKDQVQAELENYFGHILNDGTGKPMKISLEEVAEDVINLFRVKKEQREHE